MKISVKTQELLEHLQTLARVASARSAIQALAGVEIDATDKGIELRATDQELSLRVPLQGNVAQPGTVVLPARLLLDVVRQLPGDTVSLEYRGK
ncbi:MAG: DNA polymerase III subunit beta, partial [Solirubrobacterales bacterium]